MRPTHAAQAIAAVPPLAALFAGSGVVGLGGATVWLASLMRGAEALGGVCGHAPAAGTHCPACYAALMLAVVSGSLLAMSWDVAAIRHLR